MKVSLATQAVEAFRATDEYLSVPQLNRERLEKCITRLFKKRRGNKVVPTLNILRFQWRQRGHLRCALMLLFSDLPCTVIDERTFWRFKFQHRDPNFKAGFQATAEASFYLVRQVAEKKFTLATAPKDLTQCTFVKFRPGKERNLCLFVKSVKHFDAKIPPLEIGNLKWATVIENLSAAHMVTLNEDGLITDIEGLKMSIPYGKLELPGNRAIKEHLLYLHESLPKAKQSPEWDPHKY